jgi:hypothetical protein
MWERGVPDGAGFLTASELRVGKRSALEAMGGALALLVPAGPTQGHGLVGIDGWARVGAESIVRARSRRVVRAGDQGDGQFLTAGAAVQLDRFVTRRAAVPSGDVFPVDAGPGTVGNARFSHRVRLRAEPNPPT